MADEEAQAAPTLEATATITVTARFFAAIKKTVGMPEITLELHEGATVTDLVNSIVQKELLHGYEVNRALHRAAFTRSGHRPTELDSMLEDGDVVDVMP